MRLDNSMNHGHMLIEMFFGVRKIGGVHPEEYQLQS
jgi:hypothetical protein